MRKLYVFQHSLQRQARIIHQTAENAQNNEKSI